MIAVYTRIYKFPLALIFLVSFYTLQAQNLELAIYYHQRIEDKELTFNERELLLDSLLNIPDITIDKIELAQLYYKLSAEGWSKNLKRSIHYADNVLKIADEVQNYDAEVFIKTRYNKVLFLSKDQQLYNAINESQKYIELYVTEDRRLGKLYRLRGNVFSELGDLQKSVDNFDRSILIFKSIHDNKQLTKSYISKLATYVLLQDSSYTDEIYEIINYLRILQKEYDFEPKEAIAFNLNLGYFYDFLENYANARSTYTKALEASLEEKEFSTVFKNYINLGIVAKKEQKLEEAAHYFEKASKYTFENSLRLASVSNNLADIYQKEDNHQEALIHYQKAITQALQSKELDYQKLPSFSDIELSPNKLDILGYLIDKANGWIAYYDAEEKSKYLQNALETFTLADQLIDLIYVESREDLSKLFWRKKSATFYPKAVEVCYRLQQPSTAFFFMEKNKAMLLLENMTNATAKRLSKLPENILEREQNLIKEIKKLEAEIQVYATDSQTIDSLKNSVFKYKKEYNSFVDSLETNYPKYYNYKKNINIVTLQEVQKSLQENELILQYIVGKEKGFVTLISAQTIELQELPATKKLSETVINYKNAVSKPFVNKDDKKNYQKVAKKLYQQLIPFDTLKIPFNQQRITVIADGILQYIPFEALRTTNDQYLVKNAEIHYNYSLSSAAQSQQDHTEIQETFIAIAPTQFKNTSYGKLATSQEELKALTTIFNADHFQYEKATKELFTKAYGNYKIIHLSTHGGIDNSIPWIAFYDEKMTFDELYFSKSRSELVVLSACKTSDGELKKGEGVMSLARGFFNAGAKSVVSSLWDINEKASNEIIQEFYKNIAKGDTKSAALQKAKLTYIQNNQNTSEASPYYWSALTITGDISPVYEKQHSYLYYILGGALFAGIMVFLLSRRTKKQAA